MRRNGDTVVYTAEELDALVANGEDLTDWAALNALTDEEIERNAAEDEDSQGEVIFEFPFPVSFNLTGKKQLTIRLDEDVLDWFKEQGPGYQTRINTILRGYMDANREPNRRSS